MPHALRLLGYEPVSEWVSEVFADITKYTTVGPDQFIGCVDAYEQRQRRSDMEVFNAWDSDRTSSIEFNELAMLFRACGLEPMRHVLEEVVAEVDSDRSG